MTDLDMLTIDELKEVIVNERQLLVDAVFHLHHSTKINSENIEHPFFKRKEIAPIVENLKKTGYINE